FFTHDTMINKLKNQENSKIYAFFAYFSMLHIVKMKIVANPFSEIYFKLFPTTFPANSKRLELILKSY
ncbi:hypothetical protein WAH63_23145, partial [Acinetobacter baumannii]